MNLSLHIHKKICKTFLFIPGHTSCTAQQLHIITFNFICKTHRTTIEQYSNHYQYSDYIRAATNTRSVRIFVKTLVFGAKISIQYSFNLCFI